MAHMQIAEPQQQGICARKVGGGGVVNAGLTSLQLFSAIIYHYTSSTTHYTSAQCGCTWQEVAK